MFGCRTCNFDYCGNCAAQVRIPGAVLAQADATAAAALHAALSVPHSVVTVLTNAHPAWVESSAAAFLPQVRALLDEGRVSVVSAHLAAASPDPQRVTGHGSHLWKAAKVPALAAKLAEELKPHMEAGRALQVLSIGDRQADLDAGHLVAALLTKEVDHAPQGRWPVKTVLMASEPSAQVLSSELEALAALLPNCGGRSDRALAFTEEGLVELASKGDAFDSDSTQGDALSTESESPESPCSTASEARRSKQPFRFCAPGGCARACCVDAAAATMVAVGA